VDGGGGGTVVRVDFDVRIDVLVVSLHGGVAGPGGGGGHGWDRSVLTNLLLGGR